MYHKNPVGGVMKRFGTNVGRVDALSRRVIGALALLGGLVALGPFYRALSLLTWAVLALLFCTGLFFFAPGLPGGTAFFGLLLMIVSVLDGWLAATYHGGVALIIGICVALLGFGT